MRQDEDHLGLSGSIKYRLNVICDMGRCLWVKFRQGKLLRGGKQTCLVNEGRSVCRMEMLPEPEREQ